jgi:hypothetical protein
LEISLSFLFISNAMINPLIFERRDALQPQSSSVNEIIGVHPFFQKLKGLSLRYL